jgi:hypothetical protein
MNRAFAFSRKNMLQQSKRWWIQGAQGRACFDNLSTRCSYKISSPQHVKQLKCNQGRAHFNSRVFSWVPKYFGKSLVFKYQRGFATTGGSYAYMHSPWIVGSCYSYRMRCREQEYVGDNGWKASVCCMHMVLLEGYLGRQPQMARAGGDLGHAMRCCLVHPPN